MVKKLLELTVYVHEDTKSNGGQIDRALQEVKKTLTKLIGKWTNKSSSSLNDIPYNIMYSSKTQPSKIID